MSIKKRVVDGMVKAQLSIQVDLLTRVEINNMLEKGKGLFRNRSHLIEIIIKEGLIATREKYIKK